MYFFAAWATFVFLPWFTNLLFLRAEVLQWQQEAENIILKEKMDHTKKTGHKNKQKIHSEKAEYGS